VEKYVTGSSSHLVTLHIDICIGCPLFHSLQLKWKFCDVSRDFMHALYVFVVLEVTWSNVLGDILCDII